MLTMDTVDVISGENCGAAAHKARFMNWAGALPLKHLMPQSKWHLPVVNGVITDLNGLINSFPWAYLTPFYRGPHFTPFITGS